MENFTTSSPISMWAEEDRPREKFLLKGRNSLSDVELLAILIRTGSREFSALELARKILSSAGNDLHQLGKMDYSHFSGIKGIGETKAVTIMAALELGRRRKSAEKMEKIVISGSKPAYQQIRSYLEDLDHEEFWILLLNRSNELLEMANISKGGMSATVVDAKGIFKKALITPTCCSLILAHNHPSGATRPSQSDIDLTKKLVAGGKIMEICVLDHLIIGDKTYMSFADEGML
jgi:DNA repair protein RadC